MATGHTNADALASIRAPVPANAGSRAATWSYPLSRVPTRTDDDDATSVDEMAMTRNDEDRETADLDAVRGLIPAIVAGAAVWAIAFAVAVLIWA
jgi:hypothetical protein